MKRASIFNGPHFVASFEFDDHANLIDSHEFYKNGKTVAIVPAGQTIIAEEKVSFWQVVKTFFK